MLIKVGHRVDKKEIYINAISGGHKKLAEKYKKDASKESLQDAIILYGSFADIKKSKIEFSNRNFQKAVKRGASNVIQLFLDQKEARKKYDISNMYRKDFKKLLQGGDLEVFKQVMSFDPQRVTIGPRQISISGLSDEIGEFGTREMNEYMLKDPEVKTLYLRRPFYNSLVNPHPDIWKAYIDQKNRKMRMSDIVSVLAKTIGITKKALGLDKLTEQEAEGRMDRMRQNSDKAIRYLVKSKLINAKDHPSIFESVVLSENDELIEFMMNSGWNEEEILNKGLKAAIEKKNKKWRAYFENKLGKSIIYSRFIHAAVKSGDKYVLLSILAKALKEKDKDELRKNLEDALTQAIFYEKRPDLVKILVDTNLLTKEKLKEYMEKTYTERDERIKWSKNMEKIRLILRGDD